MTFDPKEVSLDNFTCEPEQLSKVIYCITKIQALYRRNATLRRLYQQGIQNAHKVEKERRINHPEGESLRVFCQQVLNKNITPEAFFRICDKDRKNSITKDQFMQIYSALGLKMTATQQKNLLWILDESFKGSITLDEFQNALEAFKLSKESHFLSCDQTYVPYEHRVLKKLVVNLNEKGLFAHDLFTACDVGNDGSISLEELGNMLRSLRPGIQLKEVQAILNFFDVNGNGNVDKNEFTQQLKRAMAILKQKNPSNISTLTPQKGPGIFDVDSPQADHSNPYETIQPSSVSPKKRSSSVKSVRQIIPNFDQLDQRTQIGKCIQMIQTAMQENRISATNVYKLADKEETGVATVGTLTQSFGKLFPRTSEEVIKVAMQHFGQKSQQEVGKNKFLAIFNVPESRPQSPVKTPPPQLGKHQSTPQRPNNTTRVNQPPPSLIQVKQNSSPLKRSQQKATPNQALQMTPAQKLELNKIIEKIAQIIKSKNLNLEQAYDEIDVQGTGCVTIHALKAWMQANFSTKVTPEQISKAMKAFDLDRNGTIEQSEFIEVLSSVKTIDISPDKKQSDNINESPIKYSSPVKAAPTREQRKSSVKLRQKQTENNVETKKIDQMEIDEFVQMIEKEYTRQPLEVVLAEFLDQQNFNSRMLEEKLDEYDVPSQITTVFIGFLKADENYQIQVSNLVDQLLDCRGKNNNKSTLQVIANAIVYNAIKSPVRKNLSRFLYRTEDFKNTETLDKSQFLQNFSKIEGVGSVWNLIGVFHQYANNKREGDKIFVNKLANILKKSLQKISPDVQLVKQDILKAKEIEELFKSKQIKNPKESEQRIINIDYNPLEKTDGCVPTHDIVIKFMSSIIFLHQPLIFETNQLHSCLEKVKKWLGSIKLDDEIDTPFMFVHEQIAQELDQQQLEEQNVLLYRKAFEKAQFQNHKVFGLFDCLQISILLTERDNFNQLEPDEEFTLQFFKLNQLRADEYPKFFELCQERMQQRYELAKLIMIEKKIMEVDDDYFDIMDTDTWNQCRFSQISREIISNFDDEKERKGFLNKFDEFSNQAITYHDFHLELVSIGFKSYQNKTDNWMYDDFFEYLDPADTAHIQLNEVDDLFKLYGYDIQANLWQQIDLDEIIEKEKNTAPKDYKFSAKDFFRPGCTTILNSERAALKRCIELEEECNRLDVYRWVDPDFGPDPKLKEENQDQHDEIMKQMMYFKQQQVSNSMPQPSEISLVFPQDVEELNYDFIKEDCSSNDVMQSSRLGNCWFIAGLSVLATRDELLRGATEHLDPRYKEMIDSNMVKLACEGVFPPIFHAFRNKGIYCLRFFKNLHWRYVIIDMRIPIFNGSQNRVYGNCIDESELWVPLIEKAYAKLLGCYFIQTSGFINDALSDLTGLASQSISDLQKHINKKEDEFWEFLKANNNSGCLMGCSQRNKTAGSNEARILDEDDKPTGLLSGHAYGIMDVIELPDTRVRTEKNKNRDYHRLLRIRNPWGTLEWNGNWTMDSDQFDDKHNMYELQKYVKTLDLEEQFELGDKSDGTFLMNYKSWRQIFNRFFIVKDFPSEWSAVYYESQWTPLTSGGVPCPKIQVPGQKAINKPLDQLQKEQKEYAKNPQYFFSPITDCEVMFTLQQEDGRLVDQDGYHEVYPFRSRMEVLNLQIFKLGKNQHCIKEWVNPTYFSSLESGVEIQVTFKAKKDERYIIIPATMDQLNKCKRFWLRAYFSCDLYNVDLKRVDIENPEKYKFIMTEHEKGERNIPDWKVEQVQKAIDHMVRKKEVSDDLYKRSLTPAKPKVKPKPIKDQKKQVKK